MLINHAEDPPFFPNETIMEVLECSEGFYQENGSSICTPSCYTWRQFSKTVSILQDVIIFVSAFIGFVAAVAVIVISCLLHKRM